jgi:hypothetical protein
MRTLLVILMVLLSGCSTIRSVGDLEVLNDVGLGHAGEVIRTYNKTMNVLGHSTPRTINTPAANSGYGNARSLHSQIESRGVTTSTLPTTVAEIQDLFRYVK